MIFVTHILVLLSWFHMTLGLRGQSYIALFILCFSSVQSLSRVRLFVTPWIAEHQASLSITNSRVHSDSCPSSQWCHPAISSWVVPFFSCPQSLPALESFSNEPTLRMRWPKYWSFSFSIIPSKEIPGLISFRMNWLDLLLFKHD